MTSPAPSSRALSSGGTLVALDGRALPLRRADLRVRARAGLARTTLEQRFVNPHAEPLRVTYTLPLPADGAVSGFRFRIDDEVIVGEVDRRSRARERFEEALIDGHTAALVEQERSSVFTQEVGNVPPGSTIVVEIEIDQPLRWLTDAGDGGGGWEYRFPTVVAPRYLGAAGRVQDASRVAVTVSDRRRPVEMALKLRIDEPLANGGVPASPSHALGLTREAQACTVSLAEHAALDRDVVVRWPVAAPKVGLHLDAARPEDTRSIARDAFGLVTLVPPRIPSSVVPRDLVVLLDTSGSMHGEPLAQAQRVTCALIEGLRDHDRLELIEFSTAARRFARKPMPATRRKRDKAIRWVRKLRAGGGTEMRTGILAALEGLRPEAQRQIVLITDGHIGFEHEVLGEIAERLPQGSRVHTVGVGSSVNRSLTEAAARAGRGLEVVIGIGEDPEPATHRLLARTEAPLVVDLELSGDALLEHAPQHLPDLFAGAPAKVAARLRPEGGTLRVHGRTAEGPWEAEVSVPARTHGEGSPGVTALFGREQVEDLELRRAAGGDRGSIDAQIEQAGVDFQIATRLTSWVAISQTPRVDASQPTRHEVVPQELPYGMSVEGLGLRAGGASAAATGAFPMQGFGAAETSLMSFDAPVPPPAPAPAKGGFRSSRGVGRRLASRSAPKTRSAPGAAVPPPAPGAAAPPPPPSAPRAPAGPPRAQGPAPLPPAPASRPGRAEMKQKKKKEEAAPPSDAFFRRRSEVDSIDDLSSLEERAAGAGGAAPHGAGAPELGPLPGRIVLHRDGRLVVEVPLPVALDWQPPAQVILVGAEGQRIPLTLGSGTTAAASLTAGMVLRLVLSLPADAPAPLALELLVDGRLLLVDLLGRGTARNA